MRETHALVAMSGGVDSSVAAWLMLQQGYSCTGGTMRLCEGLPGYCAGGDAVADVESVCNRLGIPFYSFDTTSLFREKVVQQFVDCYLSGGTPNPCVQCNRYIKFDYLMEQARTLQCGCLATGHYARITQDPGSGRYLLSKAMDAAKDQSYFLSCLTQEQLSHSRFPLGELTKAHVRQIAQEQGFLNAKKRDSQDICFIPDGDYRNFMRRYTGSQGSVGDFLDLAGNVVGKHNGAANYTIGQRKGLGIALGAPAYVCSKNMANNTVTVGPDSALYESVLIADHWNWVATDAPTQPLRACARVRYRHTEQPATVYPEDNGTYRVEFDQPQRAITPGQTVVLYDGDLVIASATIR